jgi:hypothetical protein
MIFYKDKKKKIFFIHIPRTAGRYIRELFLKNEYGVSHADWFADQQKCGIEIPHLHYPLYDLLPIKDLPIFAVIRNPFDRIKKSLATQLMGPSWGPDLKKEENFYTCIEEHRKYDSYHNNWYRPQCEFLSPNTKLWKFDWGFKDQFCKWLNETFNLNVAHIKINYDKISVEDTLSIPSHIEKDLEDLKPFVKKYYHQDYKLFNSLRVIPENVGHTRDAR